MQFNEEVYKQISFSWKLCFISLLF